MPLLSVTPAHAVIERLPALDGTALVEAAVAFHDLPGLALLEPVCRGPCCGAAAWFDAGGAMGSSILIRTLVADGRRLTFHVGGGITWRSDADAEWEETRAKASGPLRALGIRVEGDEEP